MTKTTTLFKSDQEKIDFIRRNRTMKLRELSEITGWKMGKIHYIRKNEVYKDENYYVKVKPTKKEIYQTWLELEENKVRTAYVCGVSVWLVDRAIEKYRPSADGSKS